MFTMRSLWIGVALVGLSTLAMAQTRVSRTHTGGLGDAGGKIEPTVGDAGQALCFGDGTGRPCPARNNGLPGHGCENSWGMGGALLSAQGVARISQDSVTLTVSGLPLGTTVVYMQGGKLPFQPYAYGDGLMCLGGSIVRMAVKRPTDWNSRFPEAGDMSLSHAGNLPRLGASVYYQVLYRDEHPFAAPEHFNLSNAWATVWAP